MAGQGISLTQFYATSPICTPTRASLLTGRYPSRVGLGTPLHTTDRDGLHRDEITLAETLKGQKYATACIGKWHLGHQPEFYPTQHGFDYFYGTPLGHCFASEANRKDGQQSDLFLRKEEKVPFPPFAELTANLTADAIRWITSNQHTPFFLYLSHPMPHTPLAASKDFLGNSESGLYGDACEEIDGSVGRIHDDATNHWVLNQNTITVFTSDNGAQVEASNAPFRGRKQEPLEGGVRVPCIVRWPDQIPSAQTRDELTTVMDFLPTFTAWAGGHLPESLIIDGHDIGALLKGETRGGSPYDAFIYHARFGKRAGIRMANWKLLIDCDAKTWRHKGLALYDLKTDRGESNNLAGSNPEIVEKLLTRINAFEGSLKKNAPPKAP